MTWLRHLPRFQRANAAIARLESHEKWSRDEIECHQLERINCLWQHARDRVPYYRVLHSRTSLPSSFRSFEEFQTSVPILDKSTLRTNPNAFVSETRHRGRWRVTGGSTGHPTSVYWSNAAHAANLAARYRMLASWNMDYLARHAMIWSRYAVSFPEREQWLRHIQESVEDRLRNRLRINAHALTPDQCHHTLRQLHEFAPDWVYGFSSALVLLAKLSNFQPCEAAHWNLMVLTGEPSNKRHQQEIEERLGSPAAIEYGSMDCGIMATEGPDRRLSIREDYFFIETEPRGDGFHNLLVTPLIDDAFPRFRYRLGDVVDSPIDRSRPAPTVNFLTLPRVLGRDRDLLCDASGAVVDRVELESILHRDATIHRFATFSLQDGSLQLLLECAVPMAVDSIQGITSDVTTLLRGRPVSVMTRDRLMPSERRKITWHAL